MKNFNSKKSVYSIKLNTKRMIYRKLIFFVISSIFLSYSVYAQNVKIPKSKDQKYLFIVQRAVDSMLVNARDIYGNEYSGMLLSILGCKNAKPIEVKDLYFSANNSFNYVTSTYPDGTFLPKPPFGVRKGDRTGLGGSNANFQMDLYRAMEHLSRLTGDMKYKNASHDALKDFLLITQHPETGLLAWGEHLSWNCFEDRLGNDVDPNNTHEPKRKFIYFDYLYSVYPDKTLKYARGLWDHQIADKNTGNFSRHAKYERHAPGKGYDFPKEGSYFIDTWSRAYEKTKDPEFARAVSTLANRYLKRTNELGLLDWDTSERPERVNACTCLWNMSLSSECQDAIPRMDKETASVLKSLAEKMDNGFLSLPHEIEDAEKGFVYFAYTDTGEPRPRPERRSNGFSQLWGFGYGINTTSMFGLLAYTRQAQLKDGEKAETYRDMVIKAANIYLLNHPKPYKDDIWAGEYGMAILLQIAAYRLTNNNIYLITAQNFADDAIKVFWNNGEYAVPKASSLTDYYDCISYVDTLLLSLLAVHEHTAGVEPMVEISDINR